MVDEAFLPCGLVWSGLGTIWFVLQMVPDDETDRLDSSICLQMENAWPKAKSCGSMHPSLNQLTGSTVCAAESNSHRGALLPYIESSGSAP